MNLEFILSFLYIYIMDQNILTIKAAGIFAGGCMAE